MAANKTNYLEEKIIEAIYAHAAMPAIPGYVGLCGATPDETGGVAVELYNGTGSPPAAYQGYDRYSLNPYFPDTAQSGGVITSNATITWTPSGDNWTLFGAAVWDAADRGTGNMLLYMVFAAPGVTVLDGQQFQIPSGQWQHTET